MCNRNYFQVVFISFIAAAWILITYSLAVALCPSGSGDSCADFGTYRIELTLPAGTFHSEGLERWKYTITQQKNNAPLGAVFFALEAAVTIDQKETIGVSEFIKACEGDQTYNYYRDDCYRQVIKWNPNDASGLTLELIVEDNGGYGTLMPIALGVKDDFVTSKILGPTALVKPALLGSTLVVDESADGTALAVIYDLTTQSLRYFTCTPDASAEPPVVCSSEVFSVNSGPFVEIYSDDLIDFEDVYVCLPADPEDEPGDFPLNSTLVWEDTTIPDVDCHSGNFLFLDENARFRINNASSCKNVGGRLICR